MVSRESGAGDHPTEPLLLPRFAQGLVVRNWRAGDRFWPANAKQPKKIKELLQERNITGDEKKRWPVVASGDEVVWVAGLGVRRDLWPETQQGVLILESPLA
jgi:tRNA(Ile)-lysidine synthase